ncbi:hypothetical protein PQ689_13005 [Thermoanaerobacterium thermosaccharolyticum]|uniref:hypothetical protein n=1 Tax=Thermoanaerobacterium thermosaccharolyticum TaxID=1517 RepID=UPI003DA92D3F
MVVTILSAAIVGFANFFTIIEPMTSGDYASTIWMVIGPVFFSSTALFLFRRYARRYKYGAYRLLRNDD